MTFVMLFCIPGYSLKAGALTELTGTKDTSYVHKLIRLSKESHNRSRLREQLDYADAAFETSDSLQYEKGKAMALMQKGIAYRELGNNEKAIATLKRSAELYTSISDLSGQAKAYLVLANCYDRNGQYDAAVEYALKALAGSERAGDSLNQASSYSTLGVLYFRRGDLQQAENYYAEAVSLLKGSNRKISLSNIYNNMGALWRDKGDDKKALTYFQNAASINLEEKNSAELWTNYTNMGVSYERMRDFDRAKEYHRKSISICRNSDFKQGLASSYLNMASAMFSSGDPFRSEIYLDSSLQIAKSVGSHALLQSVYFALSEVAHAAGNDSKAYKYYRSYSAEKDSTLNEEKNEKIDRLQTAFDTEKKDRQIELLNKDKALKDSELGRQRTITFATTLGLLVFLGFSSALVFAYRSKKKANRQLVEANELIAEKSKIVEEKNKDITDSITYAKTIQEAILPKSALFSPFADHFVLFQPRDIVSGDFYYISHSGNEIIVAAADCTGHGVPGAFMSLIGNELLQKAIEKKITDPAEILLELNAGIRAALKQQESSAPKDGMDIAIGTFDLQSLQLRIASAHRPVYIVRNNQLTEIKPDKISLGQQPSTDIKFSNTYYHLQKDDWIYLTSDGYADQFGGQRQRKFLSKNLREQLCAASSFGGNIQREKLQQSFNSWKGELEQIDDVMVIGLKV